MFHVLAITSVALVCLVQSQAPVTTPEVLQHSHHSHHSHAPRTTAETNEKENFSFRYDGKMHDMIIRMNHDCYIMPLTDKQRQQVHDPMDIKKVEAAALKLIADKSVQTTVDATTLAHHLARDCKGATNVVQLVNN